MENNINIGRAFREKLDGLRRSPAPGGWEKLHNELHKKKKRRIIPFWFKIVAALLGIAIAGIVSQQLLSGSGPQPGKPAQHDNSSNATVNNNNNSGKGSDANAGYINKNVLKPAAGTAGATGKTETNTGITNNQVNNNGLTNPALPLQDSRQKNNALNSKPYKNDGRNYRKYGKKTNPGQAENRLANGSSAIMGENNSGNTAIANTIPDEKTEETINSAKSETIASDATIADSLAAIAIVPPVKKEAVKRAQRKERLPRAKEEKEEKETSKDSAYKKKFYVFALVAPTFNNFNNSPVDSHLNDNSTDTETAVNYGIYAGYYIDEKWGLRAGIINGKIEHTTKDAPVNNPATNNVPAYAGAEYQTGVSNTTIASDLGPEAVTIKSIVEYLEIPLEVTYRVYGNKMGINAFAGASMLLVRENRLSAQNANGSITIGSFRNLNDVGFAANLGLSLYYEFIPALQFNIEPVFKYRFNDIGAAKVNSFGVQAGLQYTFNNKKK